MIKFLTVLLVALIALPAWALDLGSVDGTWEGTLGAVNGPGLYDQTKPMTLRIVIAGASARVFLIKDGNPLEVKPNAFRVARLDPSAVILAIDSGHDKDGTWVETWNFAVTLKDQKTLITNFYRTVNNVDLPSTHRYGKFSVAVAGELIRVK